MERVIELLEALPYLRSYAGQIFVIKAGGHLLARPEWLAGLTRDVAALHRLGIHVVLVHGGGPQLDQAAQVKGLASERVAGRRVTSPELIQLATEVWRGQVSVQTVQALRSHGETAVGLCGADGGLLRAIKRPPMVVVDDEGERRTVDFGRVGDLEQVDPSLLRQIITLPGIPVITPLAMGTQNELLNVNADTVAAHIAASLGAAKLVLLTTAPGILTDAEDPTSVLHWTDRAELKRLMVAGALTGGMRPKVAAIQHALEFGVPRVHVVDGRRSGALLEEVFTNEGSGTLVVSEAQVMPPEPRPWR
jgi:acetylglutamate kinase